MQWRTATLTVRAITGVGVYMCVKVMGGVAASSMVAACFVQFTVYFSLLWVGGVGSDSPLLQTWMDLTVSRQ
jgi:hypothetical protein